ncbi:hypothetical protein [Stieleria varia]|uniref:Secreted protein n=1 Tax=Stieleria varia TaxID=2528005 RepID=A0A5C6A1X9_9BACT|nr:hypothetical protein [Stieleria varia]TWT93238.1 hypothetical protein Pla52n_58960 [Stieleria varia]
MFRISIITALLLISVGVLTSRSAHASCGDWLEHAFPTMTMDQADLPDSSLSTTTPQKTSYPETPCDGPLCRQSPDGTPQAPSSPGVEKIRQFAAVGCSGSMSEAFRDIDWYSEYSLRLLSGHGLMIERPPQI